MNADKQQRDFSTLVATTSGNMLRLAARILGDVGEAEDAVQDAYSRVWTAMEAGELLEPAYARTYLYRAVSNSALDALRRRKRRSFFTRWLGEDDPEPVANAASADVLVALEELGALLDRLPDEQRVAIVLKDVEGLTSGEIAAARGCSEGAVEQRLVRARATLRELVAEKGSK